MFPEPEVLRRTHHYLRNQHFGQLKVMRVYTDVHSTLLPFEDLAPFQRFILRMGDLTVHPDIVGQLSDGESIFAIEGKGTNDLVKGLAHAELYQAGFHYSFLAAHSGALRTTIVDLARKKNVGVISVGEDVNILNFPVAQSPLRETFRFLANQMEGLAQATGQETFQFNIPTHYLVWAIALEPKIIYNFRDLRGKLGNYSIPDDWRSTVRGAQKLGIVSILGREVQLTYVGDAVKKVLPNDLNQWASVHNTIKVPGADRSLLVTECPKAAAILRLLLLQDPTVRLVIEGLKTFSDETTSFPKLALRCDQLDRARARFFFLTPYAAAELTDERGRTHWEQAKPEQYRSRMYFQYKSILIHAGVLKLTPLGNINNYQPDNDIWGLA